MSKCIYIYFPALSWISPKSMNIFISTSCGYFPWLNTYGPFMPEHDENHWYIWEYALNTLFYYVFSICLQSQLETMSLKSPLIQSITQNYFGIAMIYLLNADNFYGARGGGRVAMCAKLRVQWSEDSLRESILSTMWTPGIEPRSSVRLDSKFLPCWAISLAIDKEFRQGNSCSR